MHICSEMGGCVPKGGLGDAVHVPEMLVTCPWGRTGPALQRIFHLDGRPEVVRRRLGRFGAGIGI